ncbi:ce698945-aa2f-4b14-ac8d-0f91cc59d8d0 [Sclerotinia trifoliorum]|uniref:Ce698945-aa2f-4b14-ac8d-0f91cc59d8d0 n=1 Tax=Sclerotinia trifoliorum TaxID=28548 RepID=A0A8H2VSZ7_9HELO|nr:ce698945-aa2f-4b14-ac8d-0f91cc59d8d0 [Sclerotinia trifoliorum]
MSQHFLQAARPLIHPSEWKKILTKCEVWKNGKIFRERKKSANEKTFVEEFRYQTTPVPGMYRIDEKGATFLVAIQPIQGRRDSEAIFQIAPVSDCPDPSLARVPSTSKEENQSSETERFLGYRHLRDQAEVEYCEILARYMFSDELKKRHVTYEHKQGVSHLFRLNNPAIYTMIGGGRRRKNGEAVKMGKLPKHHKGINDNLWCRDLSNGTFRMMGIAEAQKAREEMAEKGCDAWCETGNEPYLKVQRYVQSTISFTSPFTRLI